MSADNYSDFVRRVSQMDIADDDAFSGLLREAEVLFSLSEDTMARDLGVSRPTITRWKNQTNVPHKLVKSGVVDYLLKKGRAQIRRLKDAARKQSSGNGNVPPTPMAASGR